MDKRRTGRLIVASNRVADVEASSQSGGLAVALGAALQAQPSVWFGWNGNIVDTDRPSSAEIRRHGLLRTATISLTRRQYEEYYLGFANKILWPAFHNRLDLGEFEPSFIEGYRDVNGWMADQLAPMIEPDDLVWMHDYHLIPMAAELRRRGVSGRIGFFLHIPFPPPEIFLAVPEHDWLARCLFAYDVVGLQTQNDVTSFIRFAVEHAGAEVVDRDHIRALGRTIMVKAFPIGIDVDAVHEMAFSPEANERIARLYRRSMAATFVIGVDRLDYTKGLPERMRAFRRLLELRPEMIKAVTFMQIAPPTREEVEAYADIREELERLSGAINGEFGDFDWTPVRYIHRAVPRSALAALYRGSRIGLVTPLRDGMNLVAKEYVASQNMDDPGVLVLSRFAGAAEELGDALIVNPYDVEEVAGAMHRAMTMPLAERRERHAALLAAIRANDVDRWREAFLDALSRVPVES